MIVYSDTRIEENTLINGKKLIDDISLDSLYLSDIDVMNVACDENVLNNIKSAQLNKEKLSNTQIDSDLLEKIPVNDMNTVYDVIINENLTLNQSTNLITTLINNKNFGEFTNDYIYAERAK